MRKASALVVLCLGLSCAQYPSTREAGPLPSSLAGLYPPRAQKPEFFFHMHRLGSLFMTVGFHAEKGRKEEASAALKEFRSQYLRVGGMVPEWKNYLVEAPFDALESDVRNGRDPGRSFGELEARSCRPCHEQKRTVVQWTFAWPSFAKITLDDPVSRTHLPLRDHMFLTTRSFDGIGYGLQTKDLPAAREHFRQFAARMESMKAACAQCHESPRQHLLGADVDREVAALGDELKKDAPDPARIGQHMQYIGRESCYDCHLVHEPPATYQRMLRQAK